jgi:HD-GYP domain-containing protein (c-di-GMP phosphodiesterase class II)
MANLLRLPPIEVERYRIAGLLHDIGKIGVPESILQKCGALTQEEFAQIKKHPQIGFNILKDVPSLEQILPGVLHHHERWDGLGYPAGLHAEQIPLIARCLAFADTFDAMSSSRSYRRSLPREHTLSELKRSASTQFDPALVDVFLSIDFADFDELLLAVAQPSGPSPQKWAAREAIAALPRR